MRSVFKILVLTITLLVLGNNFSFSQVTIWNEDFTSEANNAVTGNNDNTVNGANDWTTSCATCNRPGEFRVEGNRFEVSNTDEVATWTSETITISGYTNVGATVDLSEAGNLENADQITVSYRLNGGAKTQFPTNGFRQNDFAATTASVTGLTGTTLIIIIDVINSSTAEFIYFDNINVTGAVAFDGTFVSPSLAISDNNISATSNYTFTQTVPTDATNDFGIASGATITLTVPNGDLSTVTTATIGGTGATITSQTATTIQLTMPAGQAEGATFDIVLNGVTNFGTIGTYNTNTVSVPNIATGTNSFTTYSYTLVVASPPLAFIITNNQPADKVYGQPNFTTNTLGATQTTASNPYHTAVDPTTGKVFIAEIGNHRVMRYSSIDAINNGEAAEAVLGQTNFTNNGTATAQNRFNTSAGLHIGPSGTLWVTEFNNHRVLRFDNASTKLTGSNADGVLGQINFTNNGAAVTQNGMQGPLCVFEEDDGTLWVADQNNQRVLRYNNAASKANGANADGVLGQPDFTTNGTLTTQNRTGAISGVTVNTSGRLYVSDLSNDRVLWWDNAKGKANGANADGLLGQPDYTTNGNGLSQREFSDPRMVSIARDNKFLSVSDALNNRTMIFINPGGVTGEVNASFVFGQPDFVSNAANNGGLSASSINNPRGVFLYQTGIYENYLFVSDRGNHRTKLYVLFDIFSTTDVFTPISDTMQATELDGDVLTFSVVDTSGLTGSFNIDDVNTGKYTYTPTFRPQDYIDTVIYQVCDKDGCDTSVLIFNVLTVRRLWVKADQGVIGNPLVTEWENEGIANDSLYAIAGREPTYVLNSINFNPSVLFDGTSTKIVKPEGTINKITDVHASIFSVSITNSQKDQYIVREPLAGANTFGVVDVNLAGNSVFEAGTTNELTTAWGGTVGTPYLWSHIQTPTFENISRNGQQLATKAGGSIIGNGDTLYIGSEETNTDFYDGNIAEVLEFQHTLNTTFSAGEENIVESYLAVKYGITLDQTNDNDNDATAGTDYTLSGGLTVWEDAISNTYINDIAGIGRDDAYGLNQKQSKSVNPDAIVTIGLDTITTHNLINPSTFTADLRALLWANDNGLTNSWVSTETQYGYNIMFRIEREWLVEENNGDVGDLKIQIDSANLPVPPMGPNKPLYVVVDEDGDGDFSSGELRLARLHKTNGIWEGDINLADGEYFTFMYIHFDVMRHGNFFFNRKEQSYQWYENL